MLTLPLQRQRDQAHLLHDNQDGATDLLILTQASICLSDKDVVVIQTINWGVGRHMMYMH
jgi:hypothetical protein